ncbi:hypothetical protein ATO6_11895 [Oceanicola sp. 22II-s10i]|nr:hypothetical protein ATO6_11895 [Oceanicola sp. 22II-s10i]
MTGRGLPERGHLSLRDGDDMRILVFDDSEIDAVLIEQNCLRTGLPAAVTTVSDFDQYSDHIGDQRYDLIFVDYYLPRGDGLVACDLLRRSVANADAPVVMVSGHAEVDVAVAAMQAGCLDFIDKDRIDRDRLRSVIMQAATAHRPWPGRAAQPDLSPTGGMMDAIRSILREELSRHGAVPRLQDLKVALQSIGLLDGEGGETDWGRYLQGEDVGFVFRRTRH